MIRLHPTTRRLPVTVIRLIDIPDCSTQVRNVIRCKHYSIRTEYSYTEWIKRYIYFHNKQHPENLNERHISECLTHLAVDKKVASSTQNQAFCALVFLYGQVLKCGILRLLQRWGLHPRAQSGRQGGEKSGR